MTAYIVPIKSALIFFPVLALIISIPIFIREYRKYGAFVPFRALIIYSFAFYLLVSYFLIILPLPSLETVAQQPAQTMQLIPFYFVYEFITKSGFVLTEPSTWLIAIKSFTFLEPVFNIILFVPFGLYLRYYFEYSFKKTVLASFLLSLFFEITQLTGLYGIYPHPYRLFSVDDMMLNTLGGLLGYVVAPLFMILLPSRKKLDMESYIKGNTVSIYRRLTAFILDWVIIFLFMQLINTVGSIIWPTIFKDDFDLISIATYIIAVFVYFILLTYLLKGQTIGKKIVRIRVEKLIMNKDGIEKSYDDYLKETDEKVYAEKLKNAAEQLYSGKPQVKVDEPPKKKAGFFNIFVRYSVLYYIVFILFFMLIYLLNQSGVVPEDLLDENLMSIYIVAAPCLMLILHFLYITFTRRRIYIHDRISRTHVVSTIREDVK